MKNIKSIFAVALLSIASSAAAQELNTGYFNNGYLYRHTLNPAFGNEQGYVSMPLVGNINAGMNGNMAVDNYIYNINGTSTTFLNGAVDAQSFLSKVKDENKINENGRIQIFGVGFESKDGYNTIELNIKENIGLNMPGSLFHMMKEGLENKTYNVENFTAHADAYAEVAYGHSHQINKYLRVGAKLKLLVGIANVDANLKNAQITLGKDAYTATVDAEIQSSANNLSYKMGEKYRGQEETPHQYVKGIDIDKVGVGGYGFAADLGAEFQPIEGLKASFALLDLGSIKWKNNILATTNGENTFNSDGYLFSGDKESNHYFDKEKDLLIDDLAALYELKDAGDQGSKSKGIGATMNIGVEYVPQFYDKMSFGVMNSTRFGDYGWNEFRMSANVSPTKYFSASASVGFGTYGTNFGWLLNLHPNGINLFLAMDRTFGYLAKPGIPVSGNGSINVGVNFPFGAY